MQARSAIFKQNVALDKLKVNLQFLRVARNDCAQVVWKYMCQSSLPHIQKMG